MTRTPSGRWLAAAAVAWVAVATGVAAEPPFEKQVADSLRDVHNKGADLYNTARDYPGTFRMYEGALRAVQPLLAGRPDAQQRIADGLAAADKEADPARRAFALHETIEAVRATLKAAPTLKSEPTPAVVAPPKAVAGTVTLDGAPLTAFEVTAVSLDRPVPRVVTAVVKADGTYAFPVAPPPGKYVVIVTGKTVPARYATTTTSGVVVVVKDGVAPDVKLSTK